MNCTTARRCVQLELDGELPRRRGAALQQHLRTCESCRQVHRQLAAIQTAMHELAGESELPHPRGPALDFGHRRAIRWRAGLAAAAVLVLCVGGWLATSAVRTDAPERPVIVQNHANTPVPETLDPRLLVEVTFDPASDVIAVPIETENPNVTIIWVYPTWKTAKAPVEPSAGPPPSS